MLSSPTQSPKAQDHAGLFLSGYTVRRWVDAGLDLLFPPLCAGCGRVDVHWCPTCQREVDELPFPPVRRFEPDSPLSAAAATATHEGKLQRALWSLKYENGRRLAVPLGQRLAARLGALDWTIDMLVPVPLHINRLRTRGYNQSELLAQPAAAQLGIPLIAQALQRQTETRSQVGLNAEERQANMTEAFRADPQFVAGKTILLVDDVLTTGATLEACAAAALAAGATAVYGLTVTMARG